VTQPRGVSSAALLKNRPHHQEGSRSAIIFVWNVALERNNMADGIPLRMNGVTAWHIHLLNKLTDHA
jgi:hypothetical protein